VIILLNPTPISDHQVDLITRTAQYILPTPSHGCFGCPTIHELATAISLKSSMMALWIGGRWQNELKKLLHNNSILTLEKGYEYLLCAPDRALDSETSQMTSLHTTHWLPHKYIKQF
jgi:hypothetical protein